MLRKIFAAAFISLFSLLTVVSAQDTASVQQPRWQKIMTTDIYRYYFDTVTISYGKIVPVNPRDEVKIDKNIIDFYAQKVYWQPEDIAAQLAQLDNSRDWSTVSYSVAEYKYDIKNKKICQGGISFFDENGLLIGSIARNTWSNVVAGSDEEKIYNYLIKYAEDNNDALKRRA